MYYYKINVSLSGRHLFRTDEYTWTEIDAQVMLNVLRAHFPKKDGYDVTVHRRYNCGEILDW